LLKKLKKYGIRGLPLQLLKSYLTHKFQYTITGNIKSKICPVTCGVPQGSTLYPLLFLLHINDLPQASNLAVKLFADDTVVLLSKLCMENLNQTSNEELTNINY